jgi:hypothetical protein
VKVVVKSQLQGFVGEVLVNFTRIGNRRFDREALLLAGLKAVTFLLQQFHHWLQHL